MKKEIKSYTPEFCSEAVKLVLEQGLSLEAAARRLTVPKGTLSNWVMAAKRGTSAGTAAPGNRSVAELEAEVAKLRKEVAVERMEKEVLNKVPIHRLGEIEEVFVVARFDIGVLYYEDVEEGFEFDVLGTDGAIPVQGCN